MLVSKEKSPGTVPGLFSIKPSPRNGPCHPPGFVRNAFGLHTVLFTLCVTFSKRHPPSLHPKQATVHLLPSVLEPFDLDDRVVEAHIRAELTLEY